jgi:N6-adenosine-specific RNA methylase IME4
VFSVVVADCPWKFGDKLPGVRGAESHYDCMTTYELMQIKLPPIAGDAILFQWSVASMLQDAIDVSRSWGFTLKTQLVWVKTKNGVVDDTVEETDLAFGMGRSVRAAHETCLIATRGKYTKLIANHSVRSVMFAERQEHSRKPDKFYDIVESMVQGPYLELFARRPRSGWTGIGKELGTIL